MTASTLNAITQTNQSSMLSLSARPVRGALAALGLLALSGCAVYASPYGGYVAPTTVGVISPAPSYGPSYPSYGYSRPVVVAPSTVVVTGPRYPIFGRPGYGYGRPGYGHGHGHPGYIRPPYASRPDYPRYGRRHHGRPAW